ncbi:MAG: hypothetical protein DHS20C10_12470 [marine bacterium B5-7]|nr:MAG: hypothetical protein DHS20C10_12470 [marine bacterium B5-7]
MQSRRYFPLGKAYGKAFCNRVEETQTLVGNILSGKHSFLVAPRRYGKSSLCEKAVKLAGLPSTLVDLHVVTSQEDIQRLLLKGIADLLSKAFTSLDKTLQLTKFHLKLLKPKLSFAAAGVSLVLESEQHASPQEVIREAILFLEDLLKTRDQQAVLWLDEFQRVVEIAPDMGIEGAIRSAAQETEKLSLIFSGSGRHLIESIFQNSGRPLYKLCKKIKLERIAKSHYLAHLNAAAKEKWKGALLNETFEKIMLRTEQHPYYVNYLCDLLWSSCEALPTPEDVEQAWCLVVEEEESDLLREFFSISENQKKLLIYIATQSGQNIYSSACIQSTGLLSTSIPKLIKILQEKSMIEEVEKGVYRAINPIYPILLRTST